MKNYIASAHKCGSLHWLLYFSQRRADKLRSKWLPVIDVILQDVGLPSDVPDMKAIGFSFSFQYECSSAGTLMWITEWMTFWFLFTFSSRRDSPKGFGAELRTPSLNWNVVTAFTFFFFSVLNHFSLKEYSKISSNPSTKMNLTVYL